MVDGRLVKCNYCGTKILLRFQMGYFDIPFDICCPKCKGRINGIRKIVDEHKFEINGAKDQECRTEDIDFFADFSVELPHRKITKYESINSLISSGFSPFMMAMQIMGHDDYEKYTQQIGRFIGFKSKLFPRISAFYSMYFNGNIEYLQSPLLKISEEYVIKNPLDASMSLHQLLVIHLNTILPDVSFKEFNQDRIQLLKDKIAEINLESNMIVSYSQEDCDAFLSHLDYKSFTAQHNTLLVYDPYNVSLNWETISPFLNRWGEVIINHMISDTKRGVAQAKKSAVIQRYQKSYQKNDIHEVIEMAKDKEQLRASIISIIQSSTHFKTNNQYIASFSFYTQTNGL